MKGAIFALFLAVEKLFFPYWTPYYKFSNNCPKKVFKSFFDSQFYKNICPKHELKLLEKTLTKLRIKKRYKNFFRTIVTKFVVLATIVNKIIDKEDYLMLLLTSELHLNQRAKFHEQRFLLRIPPFEGWKSSPIQEFVYLILIIMI